MGRRGTISGGPAQRATQIKCDLQTLIHGLHKTCDKHLVPSSIMFVSCGFQQEKSVMLAYSIMVAFSRAIAKEKAQVLLN